MLVTSEQITKKAKREALNLKDTELLDQWVGLQTLQWKRKASVEENITCDIYRSQLIDRKLITWEQILQFKDERGF